MAAVFDYSEFVLGNMIDLIGTLDALHLEAFGGWLTMWGGPIAKVFCRSLRLLKSSHGVQYEYAM